MTFLNDSFRIDYSLLTKTVTRIQNGISTELLVDPESNFFEYLAMLMDSSHCDTIEPYPLRSTESIDL